jgi:hypothetical protein
MPHSRRPGLRTRSRSSSRPTRSPMASPRRTSTQGGPPAGRRLRGLSRGRGSDQRPAGRRCGRDDHRPRPERERAARPGAEAIADHVLARLRDLIPTRCCSARLMASRGPARPGRPDTATA